MGKKIRLEDLINKQYLKNEIKINPQVSSQNKEKIFNAAYEFDIEVLRRLINYNTLQEFLGEFGYDDLTEYIENELWFEGEDIKKAKEIITNYYSAIHSGDVYLPPNNKGPVTGYQTARVICFDDDVDFCDLILTKF
jgi:hypothetical protein